MESPAGTWQATGNGPAGDSIGDGLEDEAVSHRNVSQEGLNSPGVFTYRDDAVNIGTRQEIRAGGDTDGDGRADTSWNYFVALMTLYGGCGRERVILRKALVFVLSKNRSPEKQRCPEGNLRFIALAAGSMLGAQGAL